MRGWDLAENWNAIGNARPRKAKAFSFRHPPMHTPMHPPMQPDPRWVSRRQREAAIEKAEAEKIMVVRASEADAEVPSRACHSTLRLGPQRQNPRAPNPARSPQHPSVPLARSSTPRGRPRWSVPPRRTLRALPPPLLRAPLSLSPACRFPPHRVVRAARAFTPMPLPL